MIGLVPIIGRFLLVGLAVWSYENFKNTFEAHILGYLKKKLGENWPNQYGISDKQAVVIIAKLRFAVVNGTWIYPSSVDSPAVATAKYKTLATQIAKDLKMPTSGNVFNGIYTVLYQCLHGIPASQDKLYSYIRGGETNVDKIANMSKDALAKVKKFEQEVIPWYLRPATLLIVGASVAGFYMFAPAIRVVVTGLAKRGSYHEK